MAKYWQIPGLLLLRAFDHQSLLSNRPTWHQHLPYIAHLHTCGTLQEDFTRACLRCYKTSVLVFHIGGAKWSIVGVCLKKCCVGKWWLANRVVWTFKVIQDDCACGSKLPRKRNAARRACDCADEMTQTLAPRDSLVGDCSCNLGSQLSQQIKTT